ncbi:MAG: biotin-dependent carboxyltransferase family protein [Ferruginibacter sp.]
MSIKIIKPGVFSTIQDLGRTNFLEQAVPISGVMDQVSAKIANLLVGNEAGAALIEIVDGNFECIVQKDMLMALVSGNASFEIDNIATPVNRPLFIPKNSVLHLKNNMEGRYAYLAIAGGWDVPVVLGSKSTFVTAALGGYHGRPLKKEDEVLATQPYSTHHNLLFENLKSKSVNWPTWSFPASQFLSPSNSIVRVIMGREFNWFEEKAISDFLSKPYQFTKANRMGVRLEGPNIIRKKSQQSELLSTAVVPGTIQVAGDGSLILLMADCQTTGGYPRLAKVAEVDLPICAQWKQGHAIYFEAINLKDAEKFYLDLQSRFQQLATAIHLKTSS